MFRTRSRILPALMFLAAPFALTRAESETERLYLSGHGPKDAVPWGFSVTGGRRAGEQTTIPVPSNWELQGFGTYNYGQEQKKSDEHGIYRVRFAVSPEWKDLRIALVFDGVMTDATVKVNGKIAGPTHVGGFYRFRYDITALVKFGETAENFLEVDVAKVSSNPDTERGERGGDYWVFGGIFRPVWLEMTPRHGIDHVAVDARADGSLTADVSLGDATEALRPDGSSLTPERIEARVLDDEGRPLGISFAQLLPAGGTGRVRLTGRLDAPRLWTAESPNLYTLRVSRLRGDDVLHTVTQRFGFRTFEVRDGEGLFLNGQRILLKGVNRHSFRPETGRALSREDNYEDARLIRGMNMNAVRMSHYPPDEDFLEACDELGLYVLDELSGWHHAHDTVVGRRLVREMVERDVNHPSVLFWDNGNEGGWNRELDSEFSLYDPQHRRVLHPWDPFNGIDTKHYPSFSELAQSLRGPNLVMPTEVLHGLYDGGAGAGLEDYWRAIEASPFGAGAFIWALVDEGVVRTDQNGRIDVFSTYGPDGIVGPHHEKEGSYFAVKDIWSPIQIDTPNLDEKFDGKLTLHNHYDFTSTADCRFTWELQIFGRADPSVARGIIAAPSVAAHGSGTLALTLPEKWQDADALVVKVAGRDGVVLWAWSWPTRRLEERTLTAMRARKPEPGSVAADASGIHLTAGDTVATFSPQTGLLLSVVRHGKTYALTNGPRVTFARPVAAGEVTWLDWRADEDAAAPVRQLATSQMASVIEAEFDALRGASYASLKLEISPDGTTWKTLFDASRRPNDGSHYTFPPQRVAAVRVSNLKRSDGEPAALKTLRVGHAAARFPAEPAANATVTTGTERDPATDEVSAWIETRSGAGLDRARWTLCGDALRLDYAYTLNGEYLFHGITFDYDEERIGAMRWVGEGPYRVWQNRQRGVWLAQHEITRRRLQLQPGSSWPYPEFAGCYAGLRWARFATVDGEFSLWTAAPEVFLRIGTPRVSVPNTTPDFPSGDMSILHAIPAMGSKSKTADQSGPSGQPAKATGHYEGTLVFRFGE